VEKRETAEVLAMLASAYPHIKITRETAEIYHDVLQDLDIGQCVQASRSIVRFSQFFPSASEIRRAVLNQMNLLSPLPIEAWGEVIAVATGEGLRKTHVWSHQTVEEVVQAIGWREICVAENQGVLRAHFLKLYESLATKNDQGILVGSSLKELGFESRKAIGRAGAE
jgi:hypothetical protein